RAFAPFLSQDGAAVDAAPVAVECIAPPRRGFHRQVNIRSIRKRLLRITGRDREENIQRPAGEQLHTQVPDLVEGHVFQNLTREEYIEWSVPRWRVVAANRRIVWDHPLSAEHFRQPTARTTTKVDDPILIQPWYGCDQKVIALRPGATREKTLAGDRSIGGRQLRRSNLRHPILTLARPNARWAALTA